MMGLNRSTIAGLVDRARAARVSPSRPRPAAGPRSAGRPSAGVRMTDEGPYVVAVDLGVDRAVVARVGLGGRIWERAQAAIPHDPEAWQVGASVATLIRHVVSWAPPTAPLLGIGIGVPGLVRRSDGLVRQAPNLGWLDVSFGSIVLAALSLDVPVSLGNDADLGALVRAPPRCRGRRRRPRLPLRQRRCRCRRDHRRGPPRGSGRATPARSATSTSTPTVSSATAAAAAAGRPWSARTRSRRASPTRPTTWCGSTRRWTS